jgi:hypothetical protein
MHRYKAEAQHDQCYNSGDAYAFDYVFHLVKFLIPLIIFSSHRWWWAVFELVVFFF